MNSNDVLALLIYANELDGRHSPNEAKVYAWKEVLDEGAEDMTLEFARQVTKKHYASLDVMLSPALLVKSWKENVRFKMESRATAGVSNAERHCGRATCPCTHSAPCDRGWFNEVHEHAVAPCPVCRASLHEVLQKVAPLGSRESHDLALIRMRDWER